MQFIAIVVKSMAYSIIARITNIANLNLIQPVPIEGAIHISSTDVLSALRVWVAADCKIITKTHVKSCNLMMSLEPEITVRYLLFSDHF